jgi:hypothetical protein
MKTKLIGLVLVLALLAVSITPVCGMSIKQFRDPIKGGYISFEGSGKDFDVWYRAYPQMSSYKDEYIGKGSFFNELTPQIFANCLIGCTFSWQNAKCLATVELGPEAIGSCIAYGVGSCSAQCIGSSMLFNFQID